VARYTAGYIALLLLLVYEDVPTKQQEGRMGRAIIICSLFMGAVVALFVQLFPNSIIAWFAAASQDLRLARAAVMGLLAALLVADTYADNRYVRRVAGTLSFGFMIAAAEFVLDYPVYLFDAFLLLNTSVCLAIVALQNEGELRQLPLTPEAASQARVDTALRHLSWQRKLLPASASQSADQATILQDNDHRLTVPGPYDRFGRFAH
jgi:hypothetical protein